MLVRIRSNEGQSRLDIDENDDVEVLENKIYETLSNKNVDMTISLDPGKRNVLIKGSLIKDYDISEGQIIHVSLIKREEASTSNQVEQSSQSHSQSQSQSHASLTSSSVEIEKAPTVELMEIDKILEKEDGLIKRGRSNFCRHEGKGMCEYCMPLEPYDQNYLNEHKIKHLSFHSYIRKLIAENKATSKNNKGYLPPLEDQDFKIKPNCSGHLPYPKGICSKCQPSAVTLQSQTFRMVDHVEFDSPKLIDNFLQFWRNTGCHIWLFIW